MALIRIFSWAGTFFIHFKTLSAWFDRCPRFWILQNPVPDHRCEPSVPPGPAPKPVRHPAGGVRQAARRSREGHARDLWPQQNHSRLPALHLHDQFSHNPGSAAGLLQVTATIKSYMQRAVKWLVGNDKPIKSLDLFLCRTARDFDTRPGLKYLLMKVSGVCGAANLYRQSAMSFNLYFQALLCATLSQADSMTAQQVETHHPNSAVIMSQRQQQLWPQALLHVCCLSVRSSRSCCQTTDAATRLWKKWNI